MPRTFNIPSNPYCERRMFKNNFLVLEENSINCLIGCNGSGKTTTSFFIKQNLKKNKAKKIELAWTSGIQDIFRENKVDSDDYYIEFDKRTEPSKDEEDALIRKITNNFSSTGESIINRLGYLLNFLRSKITKKELNGKNLFIFFDDCDAGTSIDMIDDIKTVIQFLIEDCKAYNITYYIILTSNSYELCKDYNCILVQDFKSYKFKSYESYKKLIIKSREFLDKELKAKNDS